MYIYKFSSSNSLVQHVLNHFCSMWEKQGIMTLGLIIPKGRKKVKLTINQIADQIRVSYGKCQS